MTDSIKSESPRNERKRMSSPDVQAPTKRVKREDIEDTKPSKYNPYLAHWSNGNGDEDSDSKSSDRLPKGSPLAHFKRRMTTAKQAFEAENSDNNPFTGEPHSQQYFNILKSRRNLPVHKQRYVCPPLYMS